MFDDHRIDRQRTVEFMEANKSLLRTLGGVSELTDDLLLLMPNRVFGFVLRSRRWYFLDIDTIHTVHRQSEGFENLILPRGVARLVEGLVQSHGLRDGKTHIGNESDSEHQFDLVRGKGKGLIILLHGAPGVGKTSTAECVADYTQRPLFPITCGDIGETAKEVEQNLERNFSLAHRWGCVLLLDEADVFLQARDKEDMRRNSVVSVFLRVLEYYSGILFLTTNKVGHFDEAFKSRIHVSLYFPQLDEETTIKIWKMNLKRLVNNKKHIEVDGKAIKKYARKHYMRLSKAKRGPWNGRQIKNAFQTAIGKLTLAIVVGIYLQTLHQHLLNLTRRKMATRSLSCQSITFRSSRKPPKASMSILAKYMALTWTERDERANVTMSSRRPSCFPCLESPLQKMKRRTLPLAMTAKKRKSQSPRRTSMRRKKPDSQ